MSYNNGSGFTTPSPVAIFPGAGLQEQSSTLFLSGTIPSNLTVQQSASVLENILYSGSINLIPGPGIAFDGRTITNIGTVAAGTIQAGPGVTFVGATLVNTGTLAPGENVLINSGSVGVPIYAGDGISYSQGTITNTGQTVPVSAGQGISYGSGTVANTGITWLNGFTGSLTLLGQNGITVDAGSGGSGPAPAGPTYATITNTAPLFAVGPGLTLSNGTVLSDIVPASTIYYAGSSGTFIVPASASVIVVTMCGGGGGANSVQPVGGGGAGGFIDYPYPVNPGSSITFGVGSGGQSTSEDTPAQNGGNTYFGSLVAYGGVGGTGSISGAGGAVADYMVGASLAGPGGVDSGSGGSGNVVGFLTGGAGSFSGGAGGNAFGHMGASGVSFYGAGGASPLGNGSRGNSIGFGGGAGIYDDSTIPTYGAPGILILRW